MKKLLLIPLVILLAAALVWGGCPGQEAQTTPPPEQEEVTPPPEDGEVTPPPEEEEATTPPEDGEVTPPDEVYSSSVYGWSISYPGDWIVDDTDPASVRIELADLALVGISCGTVAYDSLDDFIDFALAHDEDYSKEMGLTYEVVAREEVTLSNGIPAVRVTTEIGPGGKSCRLYVFVDSQAFMVDAETYTFMWPVVYPDFDRMLASFTVENPD